MAARLGAPLRDSDLRRALSVVIRQRYRGRDFLLVPEVDIVCGLPGRIDALLVADRIGGFEIKSDVDSLQRLGRQVKAYEPVLEECTLVTVVGHVAAAEKALPPWWAIWVATGTDGVVTLENYRRGAENPEVWPYAVTTLVTREQLVRHLRTRGVRGLSKRPVHAVRQHVVDMHSSEDLLVLSRWAMMRRPDWQYRSARSFGVGGLLAPSDPACSHCTCPLCRPQE